MIRDPHHGRDEDETRSDVGADSTLDGQPSGGSGFLSGIAPFDRLGASTMALIRARMKLEAFAPGVVLIRQGEPGTALYVLSEGDVEVRVKDATAVHVLERVGPGSVLGEMALLTREPCSATVTALTPVRSWVLPALAFHELAEGYPEISVVLTRVVAARLGVGRHDALSGKTFQGYRILNRLGRGGMAVVYEAEQTATGRRVAVKMLSHRLVYDPASLARFEREARLIEAFEHDNIARTHGRFPAFHTWFIVMEYCDGRSLDRLIPSSGLPPDLARPIFAQLSRALDYAHRAGVVHRDVKPSNVMVNRDGTVKLMDFGLAEPVATTPTMPERVVGTPRYMAPEVLAGRGAAPAADLFALGLVLYEMLAGRQLFRAEGHTALWEEILNFRRPAMDGLLPSLDDEPLADTLAALLDETPARRRLDPERIAGWAEAVDFERLCNSNRRSAGDR